MYVLFFFHTFRDELVPVETGKHAQTVQGCFFWSSPEVAEGISDLGFFGFFWMIKVRPVNHYNSVDKIVKTADQIMFVDLVKKMLQLDGTQRIAPSQVLEHDFITCQIARTYPRNF